MMPPFRPRRFWYRLWRRYYCYRHKICGVHFTLLTAGGYGESRWYCKRCEEENAVKNTDRTARWYSGRQHAADALRRSEEGPAFQ